MTKGRVSDIHFQIELFTYLLRGRFDLWENSIFSPSSLEPSRAN